MASLSIDCRSCGFTPDYFYKINNYICVYINYVVICRIRYYFFASINTKCYQTFLDWQKASNTNIHKRTKDQKELLLRYKLKRVKISTKEIKNMDVKKISGQPKPINADNKRYDNNKYESWINGWISE